MQLRFEAVIGNSFSAKQNGRHNCVPHLGLQKRALTILPMHPLNLIGNKDRLPGHLECLYRVEDLLSVFQQLPRIVTIEFTFPNPFKNPSLRAVWNRMALKNHQAPPLNEWSSHLQNVLFAAQKAGLNLKFFTYMHLPSLLFTPTNNRLESGIWQYLVGVKVLSLTIYDSSTDWLDVMYSSDAPSNMLTKLTSSIPGLESLHVEFVHPDQVPISFFQWI